MLMSDNYYHSLEEVAALPPQYNEMKMRSVEKLLRLGHNIAERNRAARDAFLILLGEWKVEKEWPFTAILELEKEAKQTTPPPSLTNAELWNDVKAAIEERARKTPKSFEDLQQNFPAPKDIDGYFNWFYDYIPYLTLGLDANSQQDWKNALKRLRWMLEQSPDNEIFESLEDQALSHLLLWTKAFPMKAAPSSTD